MSGFFFKTKNMENLSEHLTFGKVGINIISMAEISKEDFTKKFKGKVDNIETAWDQLQNSIKELTKSGQIKKDEPAKTTGGKANGVNAGASNAGAKGK